MFRSATVEADRRICQPRCGQPGWHTEAAQYSPAGFRRPWSRKSLANPSVAATAPQQGHQSSGSFRMTNSVDVNGKKQRTGVRGRVVIQSICRNHAAVGLAVKRTQKVGVLWRQLSATSRAALRWSSSTRKAPRMPGRSFSSALLISATPDLVGYRLDFRADEDNPAGKLFLATRRIHFDGQGRGGVAEP